jgi:hypothetical protein
MKRYVILFSAVIGLALAQNSGARYLIITHDSYYNILQPLAAWKTQKGLKAKIVKLSEIGSDSISIRNYVVNAYNTWTIKPDYLLLVGSDSQIPFPMFEFGGSVYSNSDNYYANVAGDFHVELLPGRIWVYDTIQAKTVVAKILGYEKNPDLTDSLWFRKGTTIVDEDEDANPADSVYWADTWYLQNFMRAAGFVQIDSFSQNLGQNQDDVINSFNDGRSYIQYRGVGFRTWDYPFWEIDTARMANGFKLPIVISATCATVEGIGYEWLFAGSPAAPKGVVGFFGTTTALSYAAEYRSALARGTVRCIFTDSFATLGKAAEWGRQNYYDIYGNTMEYNSWTCLGDPEMNVWTHTPKPIVVTHAPAVWFGDTMTITVTGNSAPVESALVCVMAKLDTGVYYVRRTDHRGRVVIVHRLSPPDTAFITVTGRNRQPAYDTVVAANTGGPYVIYEGSETLDTLGGNGNYQPNNGEDIELLVRVRNFGDAPAQGVTGILQKAESDPFYQLADTVKHFHDMAPAESASTSADGYNVIIHPDCPDSHLIRLKLVVRDTNNTTWDSYFNIRVFSPRPFIVYQSCRIIDSIGGNNNHQVNPADHVELPVWIRNIGDSMAIGVTGILQKAHADVYFTISDTIKYFGTILPGDSSGTGPDGYNFFVDSLCPDQHLIKMMITITDTLDSAWTYFFNLTNHAPDLVYYDYFVNDSVKFFIHGDTAQLLVWLKNTGSFAAENVQGHLISPDSFLAVVNADAQFGTIIPGYVGGNAANQFVLYVRPDAPPGYMTTLQLTLVAGPYRDTVDFSVRVGKRDYLVWDPDHNHSSGFVIHQRLSQLNFLGDYQQTSPLEYLNAYQTLFITLGVQTNNQILYDTCPIIPEIQHFMDAGGKFYLEGGNVWCHDTAFGGHNFGPLFCIQPVNDNSGYCTGVAGYAGTLTQGMNFKYTGETSSLDRINSMGNGFSIFKNRTNNNNYGVAANHKTVGVSFEFSGLVDSIPPSTKLALADSIMQYFGITPSGGISEAEAQTSSIPFSFLTIDPNPARNQIHIRIGHSAKSTDNDPGQKPQKIQLNIFDVSGRLIRSFTLGPMPCALCWEGTDQSGRNVAAGVYFLEISSRSVSLVKKIILLK